MKNAAKKGGNPGNKKRKFEETRKENEVERRFNPDKLQSMPIMTGMRVDFDSLSEVRFDSCDWVDNFHLRELLTLKEPIYDELVKEFYKNLGRTMDSSGLRSKVRNVKIEVNCKLLEDLFGLKCGAGFCVQNPSIKSTNSLNLDGYDDRLFSASILHGGKGKLSVGNFTATAKFMQLIIKKNLLPKHSSRDKFSIAEKVLMWHLFNNKPVNFAQQIIFNILNTQRVGKRNRQKNVYLPHGNLLTVVFRHFKVPITVNDKKTVSTNVVDARYWLRIASLTEGRGWVLANFVDPTKDVVIFDNKSVFSNTRNTKDDGTDDENEEMDDVCVDKEVHNGPTTESDEHMLEIVSDEEDDESSRKNRQPHVEVDLENLPSNIPDALLMLCNWANDSLRSGKRIKATFGAKLFGHEVSTSLFREDIYAMAHTHEISTGTIMIYMSHLYDVLEKENLHESIFFVDPWITYGSNSTSSKGRADRSADLMRTFERGKEDSIFLLLHNPGGHWILTALDVHNKEAYSFDPLSGKLPLITEVKEFVDDTLINYKGADGPKGKQKKKVNWWPLLGLPRQENDKTCGFFVMRCMRDIVSGKGLQVLDKWKRRSNPRLQYTENDINEVREEWAKEVMAFQERETKIYGTLHGGVDSGKGKGHEELDPEPTPSRKKLLIFDLNGLLIGSEVKCMRPNLASFLEFCFQRFNVAIWSSKMSRNIDQVLDSLDSSGHMRKQLSFVWDQTRCTPTSYFIYSRGNKKPLMFKDLRLVWEEYKHQYNASNTVLIDDSPYKAFLNSQYNFIFPLTYKGNEKWDNFLDPNGIFAMYLDALSKAADVTEVIKSNRFGSPPLRSGSAIWTTCSDAVRKHGLKRAID